MPTPKPKVRLRALSANPAKNYMFNLLAADIAASGANRALDAGCGRLRNYPLFPPAYVGIGHELRVCMLGLKEQARRIAKRGPPEIYVMRLERDLSFLGEFDLCVCTGTIFYTDDPLDVAARLADLVSKGGTFLMSDNDHARLPAYLSLLASRFADVSITYWGSTPRNVFNEAWSRDDIMRLSVEEMFLPNEPGDHAEFYIRASQKKFARIPVPTEAPVMIEVPGMKVVKDDLDRLEELANLREAMGV